MTGRREPFETLALTIHPRSRLLRTWELKGGVSAHVTALEIERADGRTDKLVVRRHGPADLARNPHVAADEFRLLELLEAAGVAAPRPRHLDRDGELFCTPCLVVSFVEGEPAPADAEAVVTQLATVLADIHRVSGDVSFLPRLDHTERRNRSVLLHGDFWPGNTLWKEGRLAAVIDWEDAAIGDPLADVANARLELLWALGREAMDEFTRAYASLATAVDFTDLPHWDLWADARLAPRTTEWGLDDATERAMRAARETFVAQALEKLSAR